MATALSAARLVVCFVGQKWSTNRNALETMAAQVGIQHQFPNLLGGGNVQVDGSGVGGGAMKMINAHEDTFGPRKTKIF